MPRVRNIVKRMSRLAELRRSRKSRADSSGHESGSEDEDQLPAPVILSSACQRGSEALGGRGRPRGRPRLVRTDSSQQFRIPGSCIGVMDLTHAVRGILRNPRGRPRKIVEAEPREKRPRGRPRGPSRAGRILDQGRPVVAVEGSGDATVGYNSYHTEAGCRRSDISSDASQVRIPASCIGVMDMTHAVEPCVRGISRNSRGRPRKKPPRSRGRPLGSRNQKSLIETAEQAGPRGPSRAGRISDEGRPVVAGEGSGDTTAGYGSYHTEAGCKRSIRIVERSSLSESIHSDSIHSDSDASVSDGSESLSEQSANGSVYAPSGHEFSPRKLSPPSRRLRHRREVSVDCSTEPEVENS